MLVLLHVGAYISHDLCPVLVVLHRHVVVAQAQFSLVSLQLHAV